MTDQYIHTENLPEALRNLNTAVNALVAPQAQTIATDDGPRIVTKPSIYTEMVESTQAARGTALGGAARSLPPIWIDGCDWLRKVDDTVKAWWPAAKAGTVERLDALTGASWRPQDSQYLEQVAAAITGWVTEADALLDGRTHFSLDAPCPACGEKWITNVDALGEHVRAAALNVTSMGCSCAACGHHWGLEYFMHLAKVIDCTPIEGVITEDENRSHTAPTT